jgi:hypothetical protein
LKNLLLAFMALGMMAHAQNSSSSASEQSAGESTSKIQDLQKKDEQMKDIDDEITNAKLRATVGSKSRVSIRSSLAYSGGTVQKAFSKDRPNITSGNAVEAVADLSVNFAVRVRTTESQSVNLGAGMKMNTPFHGSFQDVTNQNGSRASGVNNPYLEYNFAGKVGSVQNYLQLNYTKTTTPFLTDVVDMTDYYGISHQGIAEAGNFSLGLATSLYKFNYGDGANQFFAGGKGNDRSDMEGCISPFMEYAFNDKYSFRTVANWFCMTQNRGDNTFRQEKPQQSMGLGISVSRDIHLYPNVQFIPQDIRSDRTNVGLSANINIF